MGIEFGVIEHGRNSLFEFLTDNVFQNIRLLVDLIPTKTKSLH